MAMHDVDSTRALAQWRGNTIPRAYNAKPAVASMEVDSDPVRGSKF